MLDHHMHLPQIYTITKNCAITKNANLPKKNAQLPKNCTFTKNRTFTGKSFPEALILASTNPQYDKRLFIELQAQNMLWK